MKSMNEFLEKVNASEEGLVGIKVNSFGGDYHFYLLKKTGEVFLKDRELINIRGMEFQVDGDWSSYRPSYVSGASIGIYKQHFEKPRGKDFSAEVSIGEQKIIKYLKENNLWDKGIAFESKWEKILGALDLYINNKLS